MVRARPRVPPSVTLPALALGVDPPDPKQMSERPRPREAELLGRIQQMKAAASLPWPKSETRYHQTVFPQMARWLPDEEAAQLCFDFEAELKRLLAA